MATLVGQYVTPWVNADGLAIEFGTDEAKAGIVGEYKTFGSQREIEFRISDLTKLASTAQILDYNAQIPNLAIIEKVTIVTKTAGTTSASGTLNIGLVQETDHNTSLSDTALVSALGVTGYNAAGEVTVITQGSTGAGANLNGVKLSGSYTGGYLLTAKYATGVFTAGDIVIRVQFRFGN